MLFGSYLVVEKSIQESGSQSAKELKSLTAKLEKESKVSADRIESLTQELATLKEKFEKEASEKQQFAATLEAEKTEKKKLNDTVCLLANLISYFSLFLFQLLAYLLSFFFLLFQLLAMVFCFSFLAVSIAIWILFFLSLLFQFPDSFMYEPLYISLIYIYLFCLHIRLFP
jgi:hypothetical protein